MFFGRNTLFVFRAAFLAIGFSTSLVVVGCGVPPDDFLLEQQDRPVTSAVTCDLVCPNGFKRDDNGTTYCECQDEDCNRAAGAPHHAPGSNACVSFPSDCDIPDGWKECSTCLVDDGTEAALELSAGESFTTDDGCTDCVCSADGILDCAANGRQACVPPNDVTCTYDGDAYLPGDSFSADAGGVCTCTDDGTLSCVGPCSTPDGDWVRAGETFPDDDGCNSCTCQGDNVAVCTQLACAPVEGTAECFVPVACDEPAPDCGPGRTAITAGGCYGECVDVDTCTDLYFSCTPIVGGDFCDALPPTCDEDEVLTYQGGCWGPCVDAQLCETPTECATQYTCDFPAPPCEPGTVPSTTSGCPTGQCVPTAWCAASSP